MNEKQKKGIDIPFFFFLFRVQNWPELSYSRIKNLHPDKLNNGGPLFGRSRAVLEIANFPPSPLSTNARYIYIFKKCK